MPGRVARDSRQDARQAELGTIFVRAQGRMQTWPWELARDEVTDTFQLTVRAGADRGP